METLRIGEVARYAGVETSAIRYYESMGLLPPPKRINGRNRCYDAAVLKRLGLIHMLRDAGFGIRELQVLFSDMDTDAPTTTHWKALAAEKVEELELLIRRTQATKTWLAEALKRECKGIDDCVAITVDESGAGMHVTLSCDVSFRHNTTSKSASIKLMTMPPEQPNYEE